MTVRDAADRVLWLLRAARLRPRRDTPLRRRTGRSGAAGRCVGHRAAEERVLPAPPRPRRRSPVWRWPDRQPRGCALRVAARPRSRLPYERSPLQAITARAGSADVSYEPGCDHPGYRPPSRAVGIAHPGRRRGHRGRVLRVRRARRRADPSRRLHECHVWCGSVAPHPSLTPGRFRAGPRRCSPRTGPALGLRSGRHRQPPVSPSTTILLSGHRRRPTGRRASSAWPPRRSPPRWSWSRASPAR